MLNVQEHVGRRRVLGKILLFFWKTLIKKFFNGSWKDFNLKFMFGFACETELFGKIEIGSYFLAVSRDCNLLGSIFEMECLNCAILLMLLFMFDIK